MATLSPTQVQIIKATVPVLAQHGTAITTKFYADLLATHPSLKNTFNNTHQATGHQARALAGALYAYAANIDNLGALSPALELICHKHASLFIQPEHYDIVGTHLLATMKTVLGDAATPDILDAWTAAYWQLAHVMISKEDLLYKSTAPAWSTWQDFRISRKVRESSDITSFYLVPVSAEVKVPDFKAGQYISVNVFVENLDGGVWQARQYSLSDAPGKDYLRISVKKEGGIAIGEKKDMTHPGYISNLLHDTKDEGDVLRISHPYGDFFFEDKVDTEGKGDAEERNPTPVVLISAGVGLTCLTSILTSLTQPQQQQQQHPSSQPRPVTWIHGAHNSHTRAFQSAITDLAAQNEQLRTVYFNSSPTETEVEGREYHVHGRVALDKVDKEILYTQDSRTEYFVCGPTQFMLDVEEALRGYGVAADRVKMELFGTGGVPRV